MNDEQRKKYNELLDRINKIEAFCLKINDDLLAVNNQEFDFKFEVFKIISIIHEAHNQEQLFFPQYDDDEGELSSKVINEFLRMVAYLQDDNLKSGLDDDDIFNLNLDLKNQLMKAVMHFLKIDNEAETTLNNQLN